MSRAETCIAERFGGDELRELAAPLAEQGRALDDESLATLEALSGGNPALATYGLQHIWASSRGALETLRAVFAELPVRHGSFLTAVRESVSRQGLVSAPGRILELVRNSEGAVPQRALRDACAADEDAPVDVIQAVQLLQAAGLVDVTGLLKADPLLIRPVASILNLTTIAATEADPAARLDVDVAAILAQFHRFGRDFHGRDGLLQEQVFSSMLAVALELRGWPVARELTQAAGYPDLRIGFGGDLHALIEVKLWPRNDYGEIQAQLDSYRLAETAHTIGVTLGARAVQGWVEDYERVCLEGVAFERTPTPANLVGAWRVSAPSSTTHLLVQIPKRG